MPASVGRNDPCPCGSGKKYKHCCLTAPQPPKRKFKAVVLNQTKQLPNLMERTFGEVIEVVNPAENLLITEPYPEQIAPPTGYVSPLEPQVLPADPTEA